MKKENVLPKTNSSFMIDPTLFELARNYAKLTGTSYSSLVEESIRQNVEPFKADIEKYLEIQKKVFEKRRD